MVYAVLRSFPTLFCHTAFSFVHVLAYNFCLLSSLALPAYLLGVFGCFQGLFQTILHKRSRRMMGSSYDTESKMVQWRGYEGHNLSVQL